MSEDSETDSDEEAQDANQYGGGDQDVDAVEQTERMQDDDEDDEDAEDDADRSDADEK